MSGSEGVLAAGASPACVVVVDDDAELRALIAGFLADNGLTVFSACDELELEAVLAGHAVDLAILDIMMPGEDGLSILRRLRSAGLWGTGGPSVIMLSAMGDDFDRIAGLEMGADDYLAKPCNPRELLARVRAVLRRREAARGLSAPLRRFGGWTLDLITRQLQHEDGREAQLTDAEFRVLVALLDQPQMAVSRDQLLDVARGEGVEIFDRAIDVTISRLRRKLAPDDIITTVRNEGYMMTLAPEPA
ncbi:MAG: response regulator [Polymorphobacter sp.]|uniref:response regulator n=1 Tax=Polymorphobacter sp. TaxID=1909290 RepID=UPI003A87921D